MFRGHYEHAIDGKGRTSLPSRFREVLSARGDTRLVITTGLDHCLEAWPMPEWINFEIELSKRPQFNSKIKKLKRIYVSNAVECDLDKLGRVLVPASLRKYADLKKEVVWAGMGKNIELWDRPAYEQMRAAALDDPEERVALEQELEELGL